MKLVKQILKWAGIIVLALLLALFVARWIGRGVNGRNPEGGINEFMYVDINGSRQWISIYGQNKDNPVLLYLHGGPGSATSLYDYAFTRKWSDVYTVVTWDQRGCGKSYDKAHKQTITAEIMMQDGKAMTEFLRDHLQVDKITLLGHSWGSLLGANLVLAYPEYYDAFIGTGQVVDMDENERRLLEAASTWSENDPEGRAMVDRWAASRGTDKEDFALRNSIMVRYGYGMMKDGTDYSMPAAIWFNPYYTLRELLTSQDDAFEQYAPFVVSDGFKQMSLLGRYDYAMPFFNINGDMDYQTNFELACDYFHQVNAPAKRLFVLKNATHGLLESRSEEFSAFVHTIAAL